MTENGCHLIYAFTALKERYTSFGCELVSGTQEQSAEQVRMETAKRADVVKRSGVKIE